MFGKHLKVTEIKDESQEEVRVLAPTPPEPWEHEPKALDDLLSQYIVESLGAAASDSCIFLEIHLRAAVSQYDFQLQFIFS